MAGGELAARRLDCLVEFIVAGRPNFGSILSDVSGFGDEGGEFGAGAGVIAEVMIQSAVIGQSPHR